MSGFHPERALIVQSDLSVLVEVDVPDYPKARASIASIAELEKSPEHVHTYRITPLSIWNAAAAGRNAEEAKAGLVAHAKYDVPASVLSQIDDFFGRWGKVTLEAGHEEGALVLVVRDPSAVARVSRDPWFVEHAVPMGADGGTKRWGVSLVHRGEVKQRVLKLGWPVDDRAGVRAGEKLEIALRDDVFQLRDYQQQAVDIFLDSGGHGVVCLPCGGGKTVIALSTIAKLGTRALILVTGHEAAEQWKRELIAKTTIEPEQIGLYSGQGKEIKDVTIATYSILTSGAKTKAMRHFDVLAREPWGVVIYDEVHLLPAPVFRLSAALQATRRLGLTATLVREDGREGDVFSLIGPKRFDVPWRDLEATGFIAAARCIERRVPMPDDARERYDGAIDQHERARLAADNPAKDDMVRELVQMHQDDQILVIGTYLDQLERLSKVLNAPLLTGETPHPKREELYAAFRRGEIRVLVVSKVANFAIDLPDASVLIQVAGTFASRQEEAQRLGRILRPKRRGAWFYTLVSQGTEEVEWARNRQRFLAEQGYGYDIETT
ncbi:MAG: DEAD/DEAH box helicase [Deltaproteobacteria bacterium]|nr:DEAD/DEAH box helicase [Deltaproteobacteria bacterium]